MRACLALAALLSCGTAALADGDAPLTPPGDTTPSDSDPAAALLREGGWRAVELAGRPILPGTTITATFGDDGRVSGSAGTNTYAGSYVRDGSAGLEVSDLATTRKYLDIPPGRMRQERAYLDALQAVDRFGLEGGELVLSTAAGPAIRYVPAPDEAGQGAVPPG